MRGLTWPLPWRILGKPGASKAAAALALAVALVAAAAACAILVSRWQEQARWQAAGLALYDGQRPLAARLAGHDQDLPAAATRCINCHAGPNAIAPALTREQLTRRLPRRGGPPSAYDEASFCHLLRSGIDPAWVLLPRAMPRYTVSDSDCRALWLALSTR